MRESGWTAFYSDIEKEYECGCKIGYNRTVNDFAIIYCFRHAAADKTHTALKDLHGEAILALLDLRVLKSGQTDYAQAILKGDIDRLHKSLQAAKIALADGDKEVA